MRAARIYSDEGGFSVGTESLAKHGWPICFIALILYSVMRMRLKASNREESPTRLLEQLRRIHQQTVQTADGQRLSGLTEIASLQKSLFAALDMPQPAPADLAKPHL